jgi:hypothetical protein
MNWNYALYAQSTINIWACKRIYFAPPFREAKELHGASQGVGKEKRTEVGEAREAAKAAEVAKAAEAAKAVEAAKDAEVAKEVRAAEEAKAKGSPS